MKIICSIIVVTVSIFYPQMLITVIQKKIQFSILKYSSENHPGHSHIYNIKKFIFYFAWGE